MSKSDRMLELVDSFRLPEEERQKMIEDLIALDSKAYPPDFQGSYGSVSERVRANPDCLIMVRDVEELVGYICFFPICDDLFKSVIHSSAMYDDDIRGEQIVDYKEGYNHLFLISLVIQDEYRNGRAIQMLNEGFRNWLIDKKKKGILFDSFIAYAVSEDGVKWLERFGFHLHRTIEETELLYLMNQSAIEEEIYEKSA